MPLDMSADVFEAEVVSAADGVEVEAKVDDARDVDVDLRMRMGSDLSSGIMIFLKMRFFRIIIFKVKR